MLLMAKTIDADTHVDETEQTWEYLLPSEQQFKPVVGYPSNPDPKRSTQHFWVIQGDRQPRLARDDKKTQTTVDTRELLDVSARLRDMDALDVHIHVMYPTLFLIQPTPKAEVSTAGRRQRHQSLSSAASCWP